MGKSKKEVEKKHTLKISENALRNIDEITGYIAYIKHQPLNAIKIGDKFFETFSRIEKNPFAYPECEEIPTKNKLYRKAVCSSWLIIYKIKSNVITILGILHSSRRKSRIKRLRSTK
ncbi:MAG: type II toxin-antitoxin system RelE/ParE family toxin [Bacteroidota bacterium]